jgi:hypothetical protein
LKQNRLDQLEYEITVFFNALLHAGFLPYVIFDGLTPGIIFLLSLSFPPLVPLLNMTSSDIKVQECVIRQTNSVHTVMSHMLAIDAGPVRRQSANAPLLPIFAQYIMVHVLNQLKGITEKWKEGRGIEQAKGDEWGPFKATLEASREVRLG